MPTTVRSVSPAALDWAAKKLSATWQHLSLRYRLAAKRNKVPAFSFLSSACFSPQSFPNRLRLRILPVLYKVAEKQHGKIRASAVRHVNCNLFASGCFQ
jgi:hypothetical protein